MSAAFDEVLFPLKVGYGSLGGPSFLTEVVSIASGYERRNQVWKHPRRRYDATTGVRNRADASTLVSFFYERAGRARGFRLRDWQDYSSAQDGVSTPTILDQSVGVGDGQTLAFNLSKHYGSGAYSMAREIAKPVEGTVLIGIDDQKIVNGWSVDTKQGVVLFAEPPQVGAVITSGFLFDVPVRFDTDRISLKETQKGLFDAEVPIIELRAAS